ncbi:MAG: IS5 family transposase [Bacteroidota bacterium]
MQIRFTELTDSQWQIIEKFLAHHKPKKHDLREIVNAILWITRTGCQWRNLESRYPKWESVYYYFRQWQFTGILGKITLEVVGKERIRQGRKRQASCAAVDSQSVKKAPFVTLASGLDGGKKVNGRKRHIMVDTIGLPIAIHISAANVSDAEGGYDLLWKAEQATQRLELIRADQAYAELFTQAAKYYNWEVQVSQKPESQKGFVPQIGRWQVERSFAWTSFFRRLSKDYEKTPQSQLAFIQLMFISIILARFE